MEYLKPARHGEELRESSLLAVRKPRWLKVLGTGERAACRGCVLGRKVNESLRAETPHEISFKMTLTPSACELHICQILSQCTYILFGVWREGVRALGPNASLRDLYARAQRAH